MRQYEQWRSAQEASVLASQQKISDAITCKCGCTWFEQVECNQFTMHHQVVLGQGIPVLDQQTGYILLKCIKCNEFTEPFVDRNARDIANKKYDSFLDELEDNKTDLKGEAV